MNGYNLYGWFTGEAEGQRTTAIVPTNQSLTEVEGEHRANWTGYEWVDLPYIAPVEIVPVEPVPESISMRQTRLALLSAGLLEAVEARIAAMEGMTGQAARIEWEYGSEVRRDSPLLAGITSGMGLTSEQVDDLIRQAALI